MACSASKDAERPDEERDADGDLVVVGILVTPDDLVVPTGEAVQLQVTGLLPEHESVDLTASVGWVVDDPAVATVSDGLDEEGVLRGIAPGITTFRATYADVASPEVRVQVTDAELERLSVSPGRADLAVGASVELAATATFSDGSTGDFSSQVRWITDDPSVVRFGEGSRLDAAGIGETVVRAAFEGHDSEDVPVVVVAAPAANLMVAAATGSISGGVLDLDVTVRNMGATGAADFWVDVFVDPETAPVVGDVGDDFTLVPYVGADSTASLTFEVPVGPGDHEVLVFVDSIDDVPEEDELDNQFTATLGGGTETTGPDLVVSYFDYLSDGVSVLWAVDVENQGDEDAGWFYVDLFIDQSIPPTLYDDGEEYTTIDGIAAGDVDFIDFEVDVVCAGCASWVMVDGYDAVEESDESNNVAGPLGVWSE